MKLPARLQPRRGTVVLSYGYVVQILGAVLALAFSPYILRTIGAEAYGLVGVFLIAQAWFQLLDAGLTPALMRETARYRGGAVGAQALKNLIKGLEAIILLVAVLILVLGYFASEPVALHWLKREALATSEASLSFNLITLILVVRWVSSIWRGIVVGFERHTSLYTITLVVALLRFPCIVPYFAIVTPTATAYFLWQLAVSLLEALLLWLCARRLVPGQPGADLATSVRSLRDIAAFAISHGILAALWILISQTDKLLLSTLLPLSQFGYFSLAVAAAAGVNLIVMPIGQMLMPRLARLKAEDDEEAMTSTYRQATRAATAFLSSVAVLFAAFGPQVMEVWTGDAAIAKEVGAVLGWYAVGNAAMALGSFSYYIQYASGRLHMQTWGTAGLLLAIVPSLIWATSNFGMLGAAVVWAGVCNLYLLTWVTIIHRVSLRGRHWTWLFDDVLRIVVPVSLMGLALRTIGLPEGRIELGLVLIGFGSVLFAIAVVASGLWRQRA